MEEAVALEHRPQLVAALQRLQAGGGVLPGRRGNGRSPAGEGLEVADPGVGRHHHPGAGHLGPPAQVEVLAHGHDRRVEPAELGEQVGPHEGAAARRHEDVPDPVVLAVVDLAGLDPVDDRPGLVGVHPDVEQDRRVVPAHHLRARRPRRWTGRTPPPGGGRRRGPARSRRGTRGRTRPPRPSRAPRWPPRRSPRSSASRRTKASGSTAPTRAVGSSLAARDEHQDREVGVVLGGQGGQRLFEPRPGVPGDHHGHDRRGDGVEELDGASQPLGVLGRPRAGSPPDPPTPADQTWRSRRRIKGSRLAGRPRTAAVPRTAGRCLQLLSKTIYYGCTEAG